LGTARLIASQEGDKNFEAARSVSITVRVVDEVDGSIAVHPAFSPNGDGINDFLIIEGIKDFPENKIRIVTRNGMEVFKIENYDNDSRVFRGSGNTHVANGTLPEGTYFYLMEYKEDGKWKMKNGWFVLKNQ
jgi:gliding motility-associated-like protein